MTTSKFDIADYLDSKPLAVIKKKMNDINIEL